MVDLIEKKGDTKKFKTYIDGIDEALSGGIPQGNVTLVCGTAGSMKSSLCFNMLYNQCLEGKSALYVSLEQSYVTLLNQFIEMGFDFSNIDVIVVSSNVQDIQKKVQEVKRSTKGTLIISDLGELRKELKGSKMEPGGDWWNLVKNLLINVKKEINYESFAFDSLDALYTISNFDDARNKLFYIFEAIRGLDVNSLLISEMPIDGSRYGKYEIEDFLADGVIMLRLIERYRKVTREISVVKMRGTKTNNDVFTLTYDGGRFKALYGGKPPLV
jgi:KaiC/GvpD/RAD55 family RecA-like ATPase